MPTIPAEIQEIIDNAPLRSAHVNEVNQYASYLLGKSAKISIVKAQINKMIRRLCGSDHDDNGVYETVDGKSTKRRRMAH